MDPGFRPIDSGIGVSPEGQPLDFRPRKFWARIGSARIGNKYAWSPAVLNDDGTLNVITSDFGGEVIQGTPTSFPAAEVSGSEDVSEDAIVELVASDRGAWFEFTSGGGGGVGAVVRRLFVTRVRCSPTLTVDYGYGLAPVTTVLSVTVLRALGIGNQNVVGRLVTATCTTDGGTALTGTTNADGVATIRLPSGTWSITVALLTGETANPNPATFTAPEYTGTIGTGAVTITIRGLPPTVALTGSPPTLSVSVSPPSGSGLTIVGSTTTITGP